MGRIEQWKNVPGRVFFEFDHDDDGNAFVLGGPPEHNEEDWGKILFPILGNPPPGMLTINFVSSGYYDPGKISGPPEDCYPPEGDDERTFNGAEYQLLATKDGPRWPYGQNCHFDQTIGQKVFDAIGASIEFADLDDTDDES